MTAEAPPEANKRPMAERRVLKRMVGFVTLPLIVLDQLSKYLVSSYMTPHQSLTLIPEWLDITYTRNPGAAFSLFANMPLWFRGGFLITLSVVAIVVLLILLARATSYTKSTVAFALILAGAFGNLIDRAVYGEVVDFIRIHYHDLSYPVFNLADSAITIGVVLFLLRGPAERGSTRWGRSSRG